MLFNTHATDHGRGALHYRGRADLIGVYVAAADAVYMVGVDDFPLTSGCLRLEPTRNNQRLKVRFAADYTFDRWLQSL